MAGTLVLVLHGTGLLPWTSSLTIAVSLAAGISMLYFVHQVCRGQVVPARQV